MKLIVGTVVRYELGIPRGRTRNATLVESDWDLSGRVVRNELASRNVSIVFRYPH